MSAFQVVVQDQTIDVQAWQAQALRHGADSGAQVTFTGYVRVHDQELPVRYLKLQHYPGVTEAEIQKIILQAQQKWLLSSAIVVHRCGKVYAGEPIVWVCVMAKHRQDAYHANEYIMDYLKIAAPFWKQEGFADGTERWVKAKDSDLEKFKTWQAN
ncbi:molybdenum cofactor biosynthesis protein MoaE [Brackiella oedipodis]|uniref:molybdenum cofactor biosynthesis protein MoaE n=1 Tax=Brackiella oedipodis TaxID=124225 RepID=UPI00048CF29F|nr:molybdenum cofactor biosynthesis protein MoaE [Brackiella oedipodis]